MKKQFDLNLFPLWTALITPMNHDGSVDYDSLKTIAEKQAKDGCALLVLGSTAEALNLKLEERKNILQFIIELQLPVPLMVGVGGFLLEETLDWVRYLNQQDIHSLLLVTPLYAKPGRFALDRRSREPTATTRRAVRLGIDRSHFATAGGSEQGRNGKIRRTGKNDLHGLRATDR